MPPTSHSTSCSPPIIKFSRLSAYYRRFFEFYGPYYKDSTAPVIVSLALRSDIASQPLHIYDVFGARELPIDRSQNPPTVRVDLATLQGRVLLMTQEPISMPQTS